MQTWATSASAPSGCVAVPALRIQLVAVFTLTHLLHDRADRVAQCLSHPRPSMLCAQAAKRQPCS